MSEILRDEVPTQTASEPDPITVEIQNRSIEIFKETQKEIMVKAFVFF